MFCLKKCQSLKGSRNEIVNFWLILKNLKWAWDLEAEKCSFVKIALFSNGTPCINKITLPIRKRKWRKILFIAFFREKDVTMDEILSRADDINLLWQSKQIQDVYQRRNKFQIVECAQYFLDRVHEVSRNDYDITQQDIVQARIRTTGNLDSWPVKKRSMKGKRKIEMKLQSKFSWSLPSEWCMKMLWNGYKSLST